MKLRIAVSALLPGTSALTPRLRRLQSESGNSFPSCNICGEGAISNNPDAVLQISGLEGKTCAELATDGQDGHISEVICNLLPLAIADVCGCLPVSDSQPPPSPTPSPDSCSCSPRDVTFQLQLNRNCSTDTISGAPGIAAAACNIRSGADEFDVSTLEISDIQFLEFGADLEVLNQNDTFANTSLTNGETFSYPSISNMLNPDMAIEEQPQYFPIGASLILQGKAKDSSGNDVIVRNQVAWTYTKSCADLPISVGQSIGWVDIVSEYFFICSSTIFCYMTETFFDMMVCAIINNRPTKKLLHQTFAFHPLPMSQLPPLHLHH